jgi:hypothetical protein
MIGKCKFANYFHMDASLALKGGASFKIEFSQRLELSKASRQPCKTNTNFELT